MKKLLLLISIINVQLTINNVSAQCTPDGSITTPGIIASPSTVDCINRGQAFSDEIQFMNFDSIYFNNNWIPLQQLRIDSVNNLPCGINWQLSSSNSIYQNSQAGCISLSGITYDTIGQYKLDVWASIDVGAGFFGPLQANNFDILTFYTRVKYQNSSCPFIDTLAPNTISACNSAYGLQLTLNATNDFLCWDIEETATISVEIENGSGHYSYQWNYGDSLSCSDCPEVIFDSDVFQTGVFPVSVTVYDSVSTLSATQTIDMTVNICGSVNENIQYNRIKVFPNPGNGIYNIELPENFPTNYNILVKDIQGREIAFSANSVSSNRVSLVLQDVSPGIYFLFILNTDEIYTNMLMKK
jgi:hypothetical protein